MADTSQDQKECSWAGAPPPGVVPGPPQRPSGRPWLAVVALLAVVGGAWWFLRSPDAPPPPPPPPVAAAAPQPATPGGPEPAAAPEALTPTERALLDAVSSSPGFRRWLDQGDALNRWALVTANLAEGAVPRRALAFLAPSRPFATTEQGGQARLAEAATGRYDAFGDVVASVDPAALAAAYRALHRPLEAAYRALGDPQGALDAAAARALDRLAAAPVLDRPPALLPAQAGGLWIFQDPKLEALPSLEKQLLRLGPRNGGIVKRQAVALRAALGLAR